MASRITATAVNVLASAATLIASASHHRKTISVHNAGPNAIYIGPSDVTTTTGFPIAAGATHQFNEAFVPDALYARAATADQASPANTRIIQSFIQ